MIMDLHSHTYYSFCGNDSPEKVIETAIEKGIEVLGICDHNYGIGFQHPSFQFENKDVRIFLYQRSVQQYFDHIKVLAERYKDKIILKCGIEICTVDVGNTLLPEEIDVSMFDYCLIENIDRKDSMVGNLFDFAKRCGCKMIGIAHTDIPLFLEKTNQDLYSFFKNMAINNIFWELNVNYDSIHGFKEHTYVNKLFANERLIEIVKASGVKLSVGFDGHRANEYNEERVKATCKKIKQLGLPLLYEDATYNIK